MASTITRRPPTDAEAAALQTRCPGAGIICASWRLPTDSMPATVRSSWTGADVRRERPGRHRRPDLRQPVRRRHRQPDRQRQPARPRGDRQRHRPRVRRPRLPDPDRHVILRPHLRMPRHRTARRAVRGSALLRFPRQRGGRPRRAGVQRGEAAGGQPVSDATCGPGGTPGRRARHSTPACPTPMALWTTTWSAALRDGRSPLR